MFADKKFQLPQVQVDCTGLNLVTPVNNLDQYNNSIKQNDQDYFAPNNRLGVSASILPALIGIFTPRARYLAGFGNKTFDDTSCAYDFCDAISMLLRSYGSDFVFPSPEKSEFSKNAIKLGKENEENVRTYVNLNNVFKDDSIIYPVSNCTASTDYIRKRLDLDQLSDLPDVLSASPDGVLVDPIQKKVKAIIEIKTRALQGFKNGKSFTLRLNPEKSIPAYHMIQIQWQMLITGVDICYYISWSAYNGASVFLVNFDKEFCKKLIQYVQYIKIYMTDIIWQLHNIYKLDLENLIRRYVFDKNNNPYEFYLEFLTENDIDVDAYKDFLSSIPQMVQKSSIFYCSI